MIRLNNFKEDNTLKILVDLDLVSSTGRKKIAKTTTDPVILDELANDQNWEVRLELAKRYKEMSYEILKKLASDDDKDIREELAKSIDSNVPFEIIELICQSQSEDVKKALIDNSKLAKISQKIFDILCECDDFNIRLYIAKNTISKRILKRLSKDPFYRVREEVAKNSNCSSNILNGLVFDEDIVVARAAIDNPNIDSDVLERIIDLPSSNNDIINLKLCVAHSENTPEFLLKKIVNSEEQIHQVKVAVLENPNVTLEILIILANLKNTSQIIKIHLAKHPLTNEEILKMLYMDKSPELRQIIAQSKKATQSILDVLAKDECTIIREAVAQNKNLSITAIDELSKDESVLVREKIASNFSTDEKTLERLAYDENQDVRVSAILNSNIKTEVLEKLLYDETYSVAEYALKELRKRKIK